jgi:hypothetical protein
MSARQVCHAPLYWLTPIHPLRLHSSQTPLNGNVGFTDCAKRKLQKYKVVLRKVADKRVPLSSKKRLIVQKGGFLLPLLTAVLPALASYIFRPRNDAA